MTYRTCWLHGHADEHPIVLLVGCELPDAMGAASVVPADLKCARPYGVERMRPATEINVERVAS